MQVNGFYSRDIRFISTIIRFKVKGGKKRLTLENIFDTLKVIYWHQVTEHRSIHLYSIVTREENLIYFSIIPSKMYVLLKKDLYNLAR